MSVVGTISIFECDKPGCKQMIAIHDNREWAEFESVWYTGPMVDFCPDCKATPEARARINRETEITLAALGPAPQQPVRFFGLDQVDMEERHAA